MLQLHMVLSVMLQRTQCSQYVLHLHTVSVSAGARAGAPDGSGADAPSREQLEAGFAAALPSLQ